MSNIVVALWVLNTQQVSSGWYYTIIVFLVVDFILMICQLIKTARE